MAKSIQLQEGVYRGVIEEWWPSKPHPRLNPYVDFRVLLTHRAAAGGGWDELPLPVVRSLPVFLNPESMGLALAELRVLGLEDEDLRKLDPGHEGAHDFQGTEVEVSLDPEVYTDGKGSELRCEWLRLLRRRRTDGRV
jgi:hypothetical protein